eukprot:scaffold5_cov98-Cylindrotheca_fusiformis.AAC.5
MEVFNQVRDGGCGRDDVAGVESGCWRGAGRDSRLVDGPKTGGVALGGENRAVFVGDDGLVFVESNDTTMVSEGAYG